MALLPIDLIDVGAVGGLGPPWRDRPDAVGHVLSFEPNQPARRAGRRWTHDSAIWHRNGAPVSTSAAPTARAPRCCARTGLGRGQFRAAGGPGRPPAEPDLATALRISQVVESRSGPWTACSPSSKRPPAVDRAFASSRAIRRAANGSCCRRPQLPRARLRRPRAQLFRYRSIAAWCSRTTSRHGLAARLRVAELRAATRPRSPRRPTICSCARSRAIGGAALVQTIEAVYAPKAKND